MPLATKADSSSEQSAGKCIAARGAAWPQSGKPAKLPSWWRHRITEARRAAAAGSGGGIAMEIAAPTGGSADECPPRCRPSSRKNCCTSASGRTRPKTIGAGNGSLRPRRPPAPDRRWPGHRWPADFLVRLGPERKMAAGRWIRPAPSVVGRRPKCYTFGCSTDSRPHFRPYRGTEPVLRRWSLASIVW